MLRYLSLVGLGILALATIAVAARKDTEPPRPGDDQADPPTDRHPGLRLLPAARYHARFSVN